MSQTMNGNVRAQRKSLATEIDRLDNILDGLAEALNESVADAVKDVVGHVVKEAVESTIKEVLSNPDLLRSALAEHTPEPIPEPVPQKRSLTQTLKDALGWLWRKSTEQVCKGKKALNRIWASCLKKLREGCDWTLQSCRRAINGLGFCRMMVSLPYYLWRFRHVTVVALGVGAMTSIGAYLAGQTIASMLCGISGATITGAGIVLRPLWRLAAYTDASA